MVFRRKLAVVGAAVVAVAGVLAGCGGGYRTRSASPSSSGRTQTSGTTATRASLREGFKAFIAAARAGGGADLAGRFEAAISAGNHNGFGLFHVPSAAMAPAMIAGDRVVAEPLGVGGPRRGDVVVFTATPAARVACGAHAKDARLIKRVVGLPGEQIRIVPNRGEVLVDGKRYDVKGASPNLVRTAATVFHVPQGKFFVLGDNRRDSCDSAIWRDPYVPQANVLWKVVGIYFPPNRARLVR